MNNIFTIVTPSLNQAKFLEKAIKSVLDQVGDFYIDYIIADGGSSDGSVEIIKKYDNLLKNKKYPIKCNGIDFRWWSKKDKGQADAINQGFKIAKGQILAWINSDDWYAPGAFAYVINKFKQNPDISLLYGNVYHFYQNGKLVKGEAEQSDFYKNLYQGCQISQQGAFFTKKVLEEVGFLDESLHYSFDYDLWLKILKSHKTLFIKNHLAFFRFWPGSKTCSNITNFKKEEKIIRKRYGGSIINPMAIHRIRYKLGWTNYLKARFPKPYNKIKSIVYGLANVFRYKN